MEVEFSGEILIGIIEIIFGISAILLIAKAKKVISGGVWGKTLNILGTSIVFLTLASALHTTREAFELKEKMGEVVEYPEYLFGILAFAGFLWLSYQILNIGKE